jgi:hypothetical protein
VDIDVNDGDLEGTQVGGVSSREGRCEHRPGGEGDDEGGERGSYHSDSHGVEERKSYRHAARNNLRAHSYRRSTIKGGDGRTNHEHGLWARRCVVSAGRAGRVAREGRGGDLVRIHFRNVFMQRLQGSR